MRINRRTLAAMSAMLLTVTLLAACAPTSTVTGGETTTAPKPKPVPLVPAAVRVGTLPTEDSLPLWVAEKQGLFKKAGLTVTIVSFQSAQQRDAAFTAGAIDGFMGDIIATAELASGGFPTRITTVMLGANPGEGRFGVVSAPKSGIRTLKEAADVPVGASSGTIQEYVLDGLMREAGVPQANVKVEELKQVPTRYLLLVGSSIKAAALPEPFLTRAVREGAHLLADDTKGENLSQTVLAFNEDYLRKPAGAESVKRLLKVWDQAASIINADPNAQRSLLVDKGMLQQSSAGDYSVNKYPKHALPTAAEVDAVLQWMKDKKLLNGTDVSYDTITYDPTRTTRSSGATGTAVPASGTSTP